MSGPDDRVAVSTNGHHPAMSDPEADADLAESSHAGAAPPRVETRGTRSAVPPVSPAQFAAGFGIIAALILLVLGRRRGRRG